MRFFSIIYPEKNILCNKTYTQGLTTMKKILILITALIPLSVNANIYTNSGNFAPYIGIDAGLNIADYIYQTDLDDIYYSATLNAGARIGRNFGVELFFTHSSTNNLDSANNYEALNHELYYMSFGFDIYGYYGIADNFDFFTTFGVVNYKVYNQYKYITALQEYTTTQSDNSVGTRFGIGMMYTFPMDKISILLQYQYSPISNDTINTMSEFSAGFRYIF